MASVTIRADSIAIREATSNWSYTLFEAAQGRVAVRLLLGTGAGWCADAPAKTSGTPPVRALPGEITRVVMRFKGYSGGPYVFHGHILPHEDNDMMRPFIVEVGTPVVQGQRRLLAPIGRPFRHRVQSRALRSGHIVASITRDGRGLSDIPMQCDAIRCW